MHFINQAEKKVKLSKYVKIYYFGWINFRVSTIMEDKVLVKTNLSSCQICIVIPFEIILTFNSISIYINWKQGFFLINKL